MDAARQAETGRLTGIKGRPRFAARAAWSDTEINFPAVA
jgi:hypothetical protein